jgi:hypothetical protein
MWGTSTGGQIDRDRLNRLLILEFVNLLNLHKQTPETDASQHQHSYFSAPSCFALPTDLRAIGV